MRHRSPSFAVTFRRSSLPRGGLLAHCLRRGSMLDCKTVPRHNRTCNPLKTNSFVDFFSPLIWPQLAKNPSAWT